MKNMPARPDSESPAAGGLLAEAAEILQLGTPADEFRRLVQARMETLAKLDGAGVAPGPTADGADGADGAVGGAGGRLEIYAEAMALGLAAIEESRE